MIFLQIKFVRKYIRNGQENKVCVIATPKRPNDIFFIEMRLLLNKSLEPYLRKGNHIINNVTTPGPSFYNNMFIPYVSIGRRI